MYEIYFAFGLPVRANIRSGRAAVRRCPDRRGRGTGGTEFQAWRTCLPDFPKNDELKFYISKDAEAFTST